VKTSDVLRKAGDVLRLRGWCQGTMESWQGAHCALGSIRSASGKNCRAYVEARDVLWEVVGGYPARWNDQIGRTAAEVMRALDASYVLSLLEEGHEPEDVL
jgi:hypothetical protein